MRNNDRLPSLEELDDYHLVNEDQDVRGRPLMTRSGERLGIITRMLVDRDQERVAAFVLDDGRTVPVEEVEIRDGNAFIDATGPGGLAEETTRTASGPSVGEEERIPIVEEEIAIGKRAVERGHIRVRTHVVETPVHEEVRLREEHVEIERRPVDQPVRDAEDLLRERTIEFTETAEEAVVGKQAHVVEEVVVRKVGEEHIEQIDDTVRHTEIEVDRDIDRMAAPKSPDSRDSKLR